MPTKKDVVLIVDDEPDCREECADVVAQLGYRTLEAPSARHALQLMEANPLITLVMTDVRMPDIDGIAFMQMAFDRFGSSRPLGFIVLTGHASLDLAVSALRFDAVDFLSKPVGRQEIIDAIARAEESVARQVANQSIDLAPVSGQLEHLSALVAQLKSNVREVESSRSPEAAVNAAYVQGLIKSRRLREKFFSAEMFSDPAWDILLDLAAGDLAGKTTSVSSLCLAAAVPGTTALRWIKSMTEAGMLEREADAHDGRRVLVRMAPQTRELMMKYLNTVHERMVS